MSNTVKQRRRWPSIAFAIAVLLGGLPLAWQFRPLTVDETRLLGSWHSLDGSFEFTPDRRYVWTQLQAFAPTTHAGRWNASSGHLSLQTDQVPAQGWRRLSQVLLPSLFRHPVDWQVLLESGETLRLQQPDGCAETYTRRDPVDDLPLAHQNRLRRRH